MKEPPVPPVMRISDLVSYLQEILEEHGDIRVVTYSDNYHQGIASGIDEVTGDYPEKIFVIYG